MGGRVELTVGLPLVSLAISLWAPVLATLQPDLCKDLGQLCLPRSPGLKLSDWGVPQLSCLSFFSDCPVRDLLCGLSNPSPRSLNNGSARRCGMPFQISGSHLPSPDTSILAKRSSSLPHLSPQECQEKRDEK